MADTIELQARQVSRRARHTHEGAFMLMWYACGCGHRERIWNSRDGKAPTLTWCPSCGTASLQRYRTVEDEYVPNHRLRPGQRAWVDRTLERAAAIVDKAIASCKRPIELERRSAMIAIVYGTGDEPDLVTSPEVTP